MLNLAFPAPLAKLVTQLPVTPPSRVFSKLANHLHHLPKPLAHSVQRLMGA